MGTGSSTQRSAKKAGVVVTTMRWQAAGKADSKKSALSVTKTALPSVDSGMDSDEPQLWHAIETAKATAATLDLTWSDQGYGNQKGMVYARKSGGQWVPLSKSEAPHSPSRLSVAIPTGVLGGKLELAYRVGGGGGHSLSIESAAIEVHGAGRSGVLNVGEIKYTSMPHGARTPD